MSQRFIVLLVGIVFSTFLFGCDNGKTSQSVFSETSAKCAAAQIIPNRYVVQWENGTYSVETDKSDDEFRKNFVDKKLAFIKHIDRDIRIQVNPKISEFTTSDVSSYSNQLTWGPELIGATQLTANGVDGHGIIVGVVDGMVDKNHVQLKNNVLIAQQFNNQPNDSEKNVHGTHVAGIIAADPSLGPVTGVAPKAQIIGGQFIDNTGGGSLGDAILALNYVADNGAKIINMSWGGAPCVDNLNYALADLSKRGILLVTAAGNEGRNSDSTPSYPAAFGFLNQINVAASTTSDYMAYFSNYGFNTVNVAAPGTSIYSTIPNNKYEVMDGTSMAAPMVSGAAALLWSAYPQANSQQIKQALLSSVDIPDGRYFIVSTRGRINVRKAFDRLKSMLTSQ